MERIILTSNVIIYVCQMQQAVEVKVADRFALLWKTNDGDFGGLHFIPRTQGIQSKKTAKLMGCLR